MLKPLTSLGRIDRGAMAAHYGSTSLVTFTAALVFLDGAGIEYEGYVATLLTVLEVPGIIVGLVLAGRRRCSADWRESFHEVLTGRSILLLVGGLALGAVTGPVGYARIEPFFGALFAGVLTLFLLEMGVVPADDSGGQDCGPGLVVFALAFPCSPARQASRRPARRMSTGGATVLGVLCASASYIAAPAAVRLALPAANPGITLTSAWA